MNTHQQYMRRCLQLAKLGKMQVAPNPMVGAVLVHNNIIIGEGYHEKYGGAHAEVNCIKSVSEDQRHLIADSVLYVSLEPCAHFGKTPPCTNLIIEHKIKQVVIGCLDTNNEVNGKGIRQLQSAGVTTTIGVLENECKWLNKNFFYHKQNNIPYVTAKIASSNDGFINKLNGQRTIITNKTTQRYTHQLRACQQAIIVGSQTVITDNPWLNCRLYNQHYPIIIVIDRYCKLNIDEFNIKNAPKIIVANFIKNEIENQHIEYWKIDEDDFLLKLLNRLYQNDIVQLLVESGPTLIQQFIDADLCNEMVHIVNKSLLLHQGIKAPQYQAEKITHQTTFDNDEICHWQLK